ncbi:MAG TPA: LarC family nickel insertion protein, partial [Edaphobacter sp.]|nr:LarC family nickel insertion protein [Edaphobacter sp.]
GAVDAIVDIVAASAGIHALGVDAWYASPLNVGGGMVDCAHGRFPVPAPATADLLVGVPTYSAHVQQELVTPTGAALVRALSPTFGAQPAMRVQTIGYGAGTRNPKNFPNVLRLSIGESGDANQSSVAVLETALDDISPQILAHVTERAFTLGALDVMSTAVQMKKGRLGTLITILADDGKTAALEDLLLRETSTLGVRIHHERRSCLDRSHLAVSTPYGEIRIKVGSRSGEVFNAAPEFEDCRTAAAAHNVPVKEVQQSAIAAYRASRAI